MGEYVDMDSDQNLVSAQFSVGWDPSVLSFIRIDRKHPAWTNAPEDLLFATDSSTNGVISTAWLANDIVNGRDFLNPDTLFSLRYSRLTAAAAEVNIINEPTEVELSGPSGALQFSTKDGYSNGSLVQGYLFQAVEGICLFDSTQRTLDQWQVVALNEDGRIQRTVTAEDGSFYFVLPEGNYQLMPVLPNRLWLPCESVLMIQVDSQDLQVDLGVSALKNCSDLHVDIAGFHIEACKANKYFVSYRNWGTHQEDSVYIDIEVDPFYTLQTVSIPFESLDPFNIRIPIQAVGSNESGSFELVVTAACDIPLGQTHCMTAEIFPNANCEEENEQWSGASLDVEGGCEDDSVVFTITNIGFGDMLEPAEFIITEDIVSFFKDNIQLTKAQSMRIPLLATGKTYRMEVEQVPFHPGSSIPRAHVEGCGPQPYSFGIVNQFEKNDRDPFRTETCLTNRGSFLPAELTAAPIGISEEHYIESTTELAYTIGFQNTGSGMIREIVVIDTLSEFLDINSVRLASTSHLMKMSFLSNRVIKFAFPNINLPSQSNSEVDSRGFVKFKVKQKEGNENGTVITNRAMLRFDKEGITNTDQVFHVVADDFFQTLGFRSVEHDAFDVIAFPNPYRESTRIRINGSLHENYLIEIYDVMGRKILEDRFENEYILMSHHWPQGLYVARISNSRNQQSIGKLYVR